MDEHELEDYIREQIENGYSTEQIEKVLVDEGIDISRAQEAERRVRNQLQESGTSDRGGQKKEDTQYSGEAGDTKRNSTGQDFAGLGSRIIAYLVDTIILAFFLSIVSIGSIFLIMGDIVLSPQVSLAINGFMILVLLFYFLFFEGKYGKTPGKMATNIKVVKDDGSPIGYKESTIRTFSRIIDGIPGNIYLLGMAFIYFTEDSQRLGDMLSHTVVVKDL